MTKEKQELDYESSPDSSHSETDQNVKRRKLDNDTPKEKWMPKSVTTIFNPEKFDSSTYHSEIPSEVLNNPNEPVSLGVDEAGRGPVLGPMVYGIAYSLEKYLKDLQKKFGFADSKTLKDDKRQELFKMIENDTHELHKNVGWATTTMTAKDILAGMLQSNLGKGSYNLNEQAHDTTIELIKQVLAAGVNVRTVYVDTVGPPATYQAKLKGIFPTLDITVAKKADSIYPIVSTASVVAKVTRDINLQYFNCTSPLLQGHILGSGYPSDPNTSKWLGSNVDPVFGWCFGLVRFLWQTAKDSLEKNGAVNVIYEEQCAKQDNGYRDVGELLNDKSTGFHRSYYGSDSVLI